jgi:hypothetical protein
MMQKLVVKTEASTGRYGHLGGRRWLIQSGAELHLVTSDEELRDLARRAELTPDTPIYKVGAPQPLVEVPELAALLTETSESAPPVRAGRRSSERAQLSEELAILNRPLLDDVEYYDQVPRSGLRRAIGVLAVLALIGGGGYFALRHGHQLEQLVRGFWPVRGSSPAPVAAIAPAPTPPSVPGGVPNRAPATPELEPATRGPAAPEPEADPPVAPPTAGRASTVRGAPGDAHHHSRQRAR